ncbi:MAG TPA: 2-oxo acid dehydrogenase subunit E2 [Richelia sp.]|nr:dihydrolipoamide acetyltransferase family protein [Richelia intracellularis]HAE05322.1 2-oxo acid dehydrogenase subunit E2 [Richelia sp.]
MSIREIFMPALSSTMTEGKIISWVKSPGDKVEKGETVVVVESDKADMDVESFYEGYLAHIIIPAGNNAAVGAAIALLAETEDDIETAIAQAKSQSELIPETTSTNTPQADTIKTPVIAATSVNNGSSLSGRTVASPRARKLAKELKVDLTNITGSGPYGRIIAEDVEAIADNMTQKSVPVESIPDTATVTTPAFAPTSSVADITGQIVPLNTLQNAVARNMVTSLSVPVTHIGYTIITDALEDLYKKIKSKGVTMTVLLAKAVAVTLQKHPIINAAYNNQAIIYPPSINIAVAVSMNDGGLITPVLQNAEQLDIYTLSHNWKSLLGRARAKKLKPEDYSTGTFTLSNLGMFGVDRFDAILPPGQGSILAVGASQPQLVANEDNMFGIRQKMQVNMTCDHRIIYGAHAAAFLQDLAKLIQRDPQSLTM